MRKIQFNELPIQQLVYIENWIGAVDTTDTLVYTSRFSTVHLHKLGLVNFFKSYRIGDEGVEFSGFVVRLQSRIA